MAGDATPEFLLQAVAGRSPGERLDELWSIYERDNDEQFCRPLTSRDRAKVQAWLRSDCVGRSLLGRRERVALQVLASVSATEKASQIAQLPCPACEVVVNDDGSIPLSRVFPIDVDRGRDNQRSERRRCERP